MGRGKTLSIELRSAINTLREEKYTIREIARRLNIPPSTVSDTILRKDQTGSNRDRSRSGRPRVTSKAEDKYIVVVSKRNRRITAPEIQGQFNAHHGNKISLTTVKRRLRAANLCGRIAIKKPLLRRGNKQKRLKWAQVHKNWTVEDWKRVLWTDESKFEVFGQRRRVYVRRSVSEKMHPDCVIPTVKHGGGSVMVWGCFSFSGVGTLHRIHGTLDKNGYHSILSRYALPSGKQLVGHGFVFQQDNDPKHTSHYCMNYLKMKQESGELSLMEWPPQSPDLNPIELLWEELDRQVRKECPTSSEKLWDILQNAWQRIPSSVLEKLVLRMPRIVKSVLAAKGGFFDEKKV